MAHTASASQLQHPAWALVNGELIAYEDVKIHIGAEALTRAVSVLEGLKGYWDSHGDSFAVRTPREHYDRLCRSASFMHMPIRFSYEEFLEWLRILAAELLLPDQDLWWRTTLYVTEGHWGDATVADLVVTAYTQRQQPPDPMRLTVSSWRRAGDLVLPPRIKSGANYVMARVARIDAARQGYDDALFLNDSGRLAEATTSCLLMVDRHGVVTPPSTEGCLESLTVDCLQSVCDDLGVRFTRRPIDRTELLGAREVGLAGTVAELTLVEEIDGVDYEQSGVLAELRKRYVEVMRRERTAAGVEMVEMITR